jgi:hypothetical protein
VETFCGVGEAIYGNITNRMHFECWITNATNTNSEYIIFIGFPRE